MGAYHYTKGRLSRYSSVRKALFYIRGCSFGQFENGKLKRKSDYWDYASLAKQLSAEESKQRL
jgi:hypothetical protein